MKKKIIIMLVATLLITTTVLPVVGTMDKKMYQFNDTILAPSVEWMKTFGGDEFDHFHSARQTSDGGYIACGLTEESNECFAWLVKVDSDGNEEWSKTNYDLNGTHLENLAMWVSACDVIETSDGGFLVTGWSYFPFEIPGGIYWSSTAYFWKTDCEGNTQWVKRYYDETSGPEWFKIYAFYNVIEVSDGFISAGVNTDLPPDESIYFDNGSIMKTDLIGNMLWIKEFDKTRYDYLSSVYQTSEGGYFLGGFVEGEEFEGECALRMVKTDEDGNLDWEQIFDGPGFEYTFGKGFFETSDGGYIMNGVTQSYGHGSYDTWLIKTDKNGKEKWNKTYGDIKSDYSWSMCSADDNGFALGICTNYDLAIGNASDILIIETDENGNIEWQLQLEKAGRQSTRSINPTTDGGYIVGAMSSTQMGDPNCDGILVKLGSFDNTQPSKPTISGKHKGDPDKEYTFTASSSDPDGQQLFYMWDWGDGNFSEWLETSEATYSWVTEDKFEIKVLVKDWYGYESGWSDPFTFSTPKNKAINTQLFLQRLFQCFPFFEKILNQ